MCGMLLNDLAVHREIILPDVACTRTHVCTRDSTSVRVLSSLVSRMGFTDIYVHAPQVTLKRCLEPDRAVMRLRVISGSQLAQYPGIFLFLSLIPRSLKDRQKKKGGYFKLRIVLINSFTARDDRKINAKIKINIK